MTHEETLALYDWKKGFWRKFTKVIKNKDIFEYKFVVPYAKFGGITHVFVRIKNTNDARWRWWKIDDIFDVVKTKGKREGVCDTLEEAKIKALEGLPVCISQLS